MATELRLLRVGLGGAAVVAAGDRRSARDRERLTVAFDEQLAAGMWAAVPSGRLEGCCRRALPVRALSEVPPGASEVRFFPRGGDGRRVS